MATLSGQSTDRLPTTGSGNPDAASTTGATVEARDHGPAATDRRSAEETTRLGGDPRQEDSNRWR